MSSGPSLLVYTSRPHRRWSEASRLFARCLPLLVTDERGRELRELLRATTLPVWIEGCRNERLADRRHGKARGRLVLGGVLREATPNTQASPGSVSTVTTPATTTCLPSLSRSSAAADRLSSNDLTSERCGRPTSATSACELFSSTTMWTEWNARTVPRGSRGATNILIARLLAAFQDRVAELLGLAPDRRTPIVHAVQHRPHADRETTTATRSRAS
jgi:hypothetical protein